MQQYTTEDLIQFLYKETTEEETKAIEKAIQADWTLKEKLEALKETTQALDSIISSPRPQSVMTILNYAKASLEIAQP